MKKFKCFLVLCLLLISSCRSYLKNEFVVYDKITVTRYNNTKFITIYLPSEDNPDLHCVFSIKDVTTKLESDFIDICDKFEIGDIVSFQRLKKN